ncbi:MAG: hypothetical protein QM736_11130 [Vicinamibacterales bacterium]
MESVSAGRVDLIGLTRALVDIDSTTGREGQAATFLSRYLRNLQLTVTEQQVDYHRFTSSPRAEVRQRSCSRRTSTVCRRSSRAA